MTRTERQRARVRAIIVEHGAIALIERRRNGRHYVVFPGGGVKPDESMDDALRREIREELGLDVEIGEEVATVDFGDHPQHFFLVTVQSGEFGTGTGPEFTAPSTVRGTYYPRWMPVQQLPKLPVYPVDIAKLVITGQVEGWPSTPVVFEDRTWTMD